MIKIDPTQLQEIMNEKKEVIQFLSNLKEAGARKTNFGWALDFDMDEDKYSAVVLAYNCGGGLVPFNLCLTHQVYVEKLLKKFEEKRDIRYFVVIPINSDDYIELTGDRYKVDERWAD